MKPPVTELWRVGVVHRPMASMLPKKSLADAPVTWLPDPGPFRFIADPFAITRGGETTVFVEALDYRIKRGEIHYYHYDVDWHLQAQGVALRAPFHLSYPFLIALGAEVYMLPEASRSGKLTLYRAASFPAQWEPVATLLDLPAIDASPIFYQGRWWMFYALPGPDSRPLRELHLAYAETLMGPWTQHPKNPVRVGLDSARPGGTPFVHEDQLYLPVQDSVETYGKAVQLLRVDQLTVDDFAATPVTRITADRGPHLTYQDGLHTLSACGEVTLMDVKRLLHSNTRRWIDWQRRLRRLWVF